MLEAVFFVFMQAYTGVQRDIGVTHAQVPLDPGLHAPRAVGAVVRPNLDCIVGAGGARQVTVFVNVGGWIDQHVAQAHAANGLHFVPVAREIVAVSGHFAAPVLVGVDDVGRLVLLVLGHKIIVRRSRIAAEWIRREVRIGQSEISLVGDLVRVAEFHAQTLVNQARRVAVELKFRDVVLDVKTGVAADRSVDGLEAVAVRLHSLQQPAESIAAAAHIQMRVKGTVITEPQIGIRAHRVRNRCRDHVHRATRRARANGDGSRSLEDLNRTHAALCGEVVSGGGSVGRWRDQHAILEQGDASAAIQARAANADIRPEAEAFLFLHVDAWNGAQHTQDVRLGESGKLLAVDDVC